MDPQPPLSTTGSSPTPTLTSTGISTSSSNLSEWEIIPTPDIRQDDAVAVVSETSTTRRLAPVIIELPTASQTPASITLAIPESLPRLGSINARTTLAPSRGYSEPQPQPSTDGASADRARRCRERPATPFRNFVDGETLSSGQHLTTDYRIRRLVRGAFAEPGCRTPPIVCTGVGSATTPTMPTRRGRASIAEPRGPTLKTLRRRSLAAGIISAVSRYLLKLNL